MHCWKGANYKTQLSQIHLCIKPTTSIGALGIESDSEKLRLHRRFYTLEVTAGQGHFVEIVYICKWHFNTCSVPLSICPPSEQSCNWLQNISNENENCRSTSAALALLLLRDVALVRERDAGRHNAFCTSLLFVVQNLCKAQCTTQKESCSAHLLFYAPSKTMKHGICVFSTVY